MKQHNKFNKHVKQNAKYQGEGGRMQTCKNELPLRASVQLKERRSGRLREKYTEAMVKR
jgi:hypothetical protein